MWFNIIKRPFDIEREIDINESSKTIRDNFGWQDKIKIFGEKYLDGWLKETFLSRPNMKRFVINFREIPVDARQKFIKLVINVGKERVEQYMSNLYNVNVKLNGQTIDTLGLYWEFIFTRN